jgi:hypothetical protein
MKPITKIRMARDVFGLRVIQSMTELTTDEIVLMNLSILIFMDKTWIFN